MVTTKIRTNLLELSSESIEKTDENTFSALDKDVKSIEVKQL